jgi:hypothetical protein
VKTYSLINVYSLEENKVPGAVGRIGWLFALLETVLNTSLSLGLILASISTLSGGAKLVVSAVQKPQYVYL